MPAPTLEQLRRYAVARSFFAPTTLGRAVAKLGFVQADPIRAPAVAQDLTLRHRVVDYRAGDLERRYARLALEEGFFVNYGFMPREHYARMHPRVNRRNWGRKSWDRKTTRRAGELLAFIEQHDAVHPRDVDAHFGLGTVRNYWGGRSSATTHLLEAMHYSGLLRVVRRDGGIRIYAAHEHPPAPRDRSERDARLDALVDLMVHAYAPLPSGTLTWLINRLQWTTPQWAAQRKPTLARAKQRLAHARIDGVEWYWPAHERPASRRYVVNERVRLLTPFDPLVWDRRRFELFWTWTYRFEAYTPVAKRKLGYYALPLLWRDQVIGWANATRNGEFDLRFVTSRPRERAFEHELEAELMRMRAFLVSR